MNIRLGTVRGPRGDAGPTPSWTPVVLAVDVEATEMADRWNDRIDEHGNYLDPTNSEGQPS